MEKPMGNTYINIQSWMISELNLKGNELMIYAIIYGFCQDGKGVFRGGRTYLASWTNSTVRGVQKNLNSLLEKGIIAKEENIVNGVKVCNYYTINLPWEKKEDISGQCEKEMEEGTVLGGEQSSLRAGNKVPSGREQSSLRAGNKVPSGREQSSPNNIKGNIKSNIKSSSSGDSSLTPSLQQTGFSAAVIEKWNMLQPLGIKAVSQIHQSSERYKMLKARMQQYGLDSVLLAIDNIKKSKFLCGHNKNGWMITFDWFVRPNNFPKVLEGNYEDKDGEIDGRCKNGRSVGQVSGEQTKYDPEQYFGKAFF